MIKYDVTRLHLKNRISEILVLIFEFATQFKYVGGDDGTNIDGTYQLDNFNKLIFCRYEVSLSLSKNILSLPIHPYLSDEQIEKIGKFIDRPQSCITFPNKNKWNVIYKLHQ